MKVSKKIIIPLVAVSIAAVTAATPVSAWVHAASDGAGATTSSSGRTCSASIYFSGGGSAGNTGATSAYISSSSYPGKTVTGSIAKVTHLNNDGVTVVDEFDSWPN